MSSFDIELTGLGGLMLVCRRERRDSRGSLSRLFCAEDLVAAGWTWPIHQINHTRTLRRGCVRGMHFQREPFAEAKLVSCVRGQVFDVAVDLRPTSPTFLRWHAAVLTGDNGCALMIPQGFAHGFQALSDGVELVYCHSAAYAASAEGGLHPLDPMLAIHWPLPVTELSDRDANHPPLAERRSLAEGLSI